MPVVRAGTKISFRGGGDSFQFNIRFRVAQVKVTTSTVYFLLSSGNTEVGIPVIPSNSYYYPSYVYNLVRLFELWRLDRADFIYLPRINTSSSAAFVLAAPKDPVWPLTHGATDGSGHYAPTEAQLVSLTDACTVVAYNDCTVRAPVNDFTMNKGWLTTANTNLSGQIDFKTYSDTVIRSTIGATLLICGLPNGTADTSVIGDLYLDLTISLRDFSTAVTTAIDYSDQEKKVRRCGEELPTDIEECVVVKKSVSRK